MNILLFVYLLLLLFLGCLPIEKVDSWIYGDVTCGCPNSCHDSGALAEKNDSPWNCYDRIHYFIGHYHMNETQACIASSKDPTKSEEDNLVRPCRPEACHPTKCTNINPNPPPASNNNANNNANNNGNYNPDDPSNDQDNNNNDSNDDDGNNNNNNHMDDPSHTTNENKDNQNAVVDAMTSTKNMRSITLGITIGLIIVFCACFLGCCNGKSFVKSKLMSNNASSSSSKKNPTDDIRGDVGGFRDDETGEDRFRDEEVEMPSKRKSPSHGYKDPLST